MVISASKWLKINLYTHIQENKMIYTNKAHFNNSFYRSYDFSILINFDGFIILIKKIRKLEKYKKYERADTPLK